MSLINALRVFATIFRVAFSRPHYCKLKLESKLFKLCFESGDIVEGGSEPKALDKGLILGVSAIAIGAATAGLMLW